ncbi:MAG: MBL fold metallo-hydrolase [Thermoanaerobaculia bacterium]
MAVFQESLRSAPARAAPLLRSIRRTSGDCVLVLFVVFLAPNSLQALDGTPAGFRNRIRNLYDAFGYGKRGTSLDWGYSAFVEFNGKTILFDSGSRADLLAQNAKALGIDLAKVDIAVLSHRHADHASGFDYLLKVNPNVTLYLPSDRGLGAPEHWTFDKPPESARIPPEEMYWGGKKTSIAYKSSGRFWNARVEWVNAAREVAPGVFVIPTTGSMMGDFSKYPPNEKRPDLIGIPELSLALKTSKGMVLLVGCAHSTIERIVIEAMSLLKTDVELLAGGFHLLPYSSEEITALAQKLKADLAVRRIAPAHCSGVQAMQIFKKVFGEGYSYAGLESEVFFGP